MLQTCTVFTQINVLYTQIQTLNLLMNTKYMYIYSSMHLLKTSRTMTTISLKATNSTPIPVLNWGTGTIYGLHFSFQKCTCKTLTWDSFTSRYSPATPISLKLISSHNSVSRIFYWKPQDKMPFFHKTVWKSNMHHIQHYFHHTDCHSNSACSFQTSYTNRDERIIMVTRTQCCITSSTWAASSWCAVWRRNFLLTLNLNNIIHHMEKFGLHCCRTRAANRVGRL